MRSSVRDWQNKSDEELIALLRKAETGKDTFDQSMIMDYLLEKYKKPETLAYGRKKWEQYRKRSDIRSYLMHSMMYRLYQLEPLKDDWRDWLKDCETTLYEKISPYEYQGYCQQFDKNQCDEL